MKQGGEVIRESFPPKMASIYPTPKVLDYTIHNAQLLKLYRDTKKHVCEVKGHVMITLNCDMTSQMYHLPNVLYHSTKARVP